MNVSSDHTAKKPKVLDCKCSSAYQDERYGKGLRLHNPKSAKSGTAYRCTVCGAERN